MGENENVRAPAVQDRPARARATDEPSQPAGKAQKSSISYQCPLVVSVHGIRTDGAWQKTFSSVMSGGKTQTRSFEYGRYGLLKFLIPPFNDRLIDKFYDWVSVIIDSCPQVDLDLYDRRPSVVAHSMGTWIVGNAMLKHEDLRFDKLIFAGSILPRDFDWGTLFSRDQVAFVRNECGQKDPWPKWAGHFVSRTGTGGYEGFEWPSSAIENVLSEWLGHSDTLMWRHIDEHWKKNTLSRQPFPFKLLHGRAIHVEEEFRRILLHVLTAIDPEAYGRLPRFEEAHPTLERAVEWARANPDIYSFLVDRRTGDPAGYINAMPVDDAVYSEIRSGAFADGKIPGANIPPYAKSNGIKIYLMSIAVKEKHRRWGEGLFQDTYLRLVAGFVDKLIWYAKHHRVAVSHLLATAWRPEGYRLCKHFGMEEVGVDRFGYTILELSISNLQRGPASNVPHVFRRLVQVYNELKLLSA